MSKIGISLVSAYTAITLYAVYYASTCGPGLCGLAGVIPLTPWLQLFEGFLDIDIPKIVLPVFFIINAIIIYYIGKFVSMIIYKLAN